MDTGGIGYEVFVPLSTFYALPECSESVRLHIYTHVREDTIALFGFHTELEKTLFLMLISVSGIGPKLAVNILSGIGPDDLLGAMAQGDSNRLRAIPGVGKKTAERISLELKDKAAEAMGSQPEEAATAIGGVDRELIDDAMSAFINLGYSAKAAKQAVEKALSSIEEVSLEGLIKEALKALA
ncbi:Holliday junction branch migration protein RuvA [Thermodesulfobacteriota bacterium]